MLSVHGVQTTLRSERRYKHFNLLDQLLRKEFGPIVPQALPAKRAFGNLQPSFVEERRVALEKYLQQCLAIPALATSSLFCNFLEADVKDSDRANFEDGEELLHHSLHRVCTKQGHLYAAPPTAPPALRAACPARPPHALRCGGCIPPAPRVACSTWWCASRPSAPRHPRCAG